MAERFVLGDMMLKGDVGYDRVRRLSYSDADLVIICFSISSPQSMENVVSKWHPEVRENCPSQPVMLVGCQADVRAEAKTLPPGAARPTLVSYDQGLKTSKHIGALVYSETSSKTSQCNVNDVMEVAALSSAGTTGMGATGGAGGVGSGDGSGSIDRRHRSILRHKRFSGLNEARVHLRRGSQKLCPHVTGERSFLDVKPRRWSVIPGPETSLTALSDVV